MNPFPMARRHAINLNDAGTSVRTVADLVRIGVSAFCAADLSYGHGTDNAYDESVALVLWALHLPPDTPDALLSCHVTAAETNSVIGIIQQRIESRTPLGYLTGETWFRGLRFLSDPRALIPRSLLVEALQEGLPDWLEIHAPDCFEQSEPMKILDLCTGGGSIAIHAASQYPHAELTAVDLEPDALALCRENLALHQLSDRVRPICSNLFEALDPSEPFDLILCNPPYVPAASMDSLPPEYLAEPQVALAAGDDGMSLVRRILAQATSHMTPEAIMLLEIGHEIDAFVAAFPNLSFSTVPVQAGDEMILLITAAQLSEATLR